MDRRLFLAGTAAGVSTLALPVLPPDPSNPAFMLHRELVKRGAKFKPAVRQDIDDRLGDYAADDSCVFDIEKAVVYLADKLFDQYKFERRNWTFQFQSGKFDTWSDTADRGTTYRYKDVVVNVFEFQAENGHRPMVTVLRCGCI